ncbi:MAG: C45 family peptidase [Planctomycetota bacterium]
MPIDLIEIKGAPREMGRQHGEMFRSQIREFVDIRLSRLLKAMREGHIAADRDAVLRLAAEHLPFHERYSRPVVEEFMGIAEASGVPSEELMIGNGLTDLKDVALQNMGKGGCTAFIANRNGTKDRQVWFGQNWDMHADAEPYVVAFLRRPDDAPMTLTVTTTGCLSLVGINEEGIGVGNNNLVPRDARPGVMYLAMLHHALAQRTFNDAVGAITTAHRASGHNYFVVSAEGRICFIETTATDYEIIDQDKPVAVHANHYRAPRLVDKGVSQERPGASSLNREKRLAEILGEKINMDLVIAGLSDREPNLQTCICRMGGDATTCAAIVCKPATGEVWATRGNLRENELVRLHL